MNAKMIKVLVKWVLPISFVAGCAHNDQLALRNPYPAGSLGPVSNRAQNRVYAGDAADTAPVPQGASPEDWKLAEAIRGMLASDPHLSRSQVVAVVKGGVVTLRGSVRTSQQRREVVQMVQDLAGVTRVDDQMSVSALPTVGPQTVSPN